MLKAYLLQILITVQKYHTKLTGSVRWLLSGPALRARHSLSRGGALTAVKTLSDFICSAVVGIVRVLEMDECIY